MSQTMRKWVARALSFVTVLGPLGLSVVGDPPNAWASYAATLTAPAKNKLLWPFDPQKIVDTFAIKGIIDGYYRLVILRHDCNQLVCPSGGRINNYNPQGTELISLNAQDGTSYTVLAGGQTAPWLGPLTKGAPFGTTLYTVNAATITQMLEEGNYTILLDVKDTATGSITSASVRFFVETRFNPDFGAGKGITYLNTTVTGDVTLGDITGDGKPEIIVGASTTGQEQIRAVDGAGANVYTSQPLGGRIFGSVAVGDIDDDGKPEFAAGLDASGYSLWALKYSDPAWIIKKQPGQMKSTPALVEHLLDPTVIAVTTKNNLLYAYEYDAALSTLQLVGSQPTTCVADADGAPPWDPNSYQGMNKPSNCAGSPLMETNSPMVLLGRPVLDASGGGVGYFRLFTMSLDAISFYGHLITRPYVYAPNATGLELLQTFPMVWSPQGSNPQTQPAEPGSGGIFNATGADFHNFGRAQIFAKQPVFDNTTLTCPSDPTTCKDTNRLVLLETDEGAGSIGTWNQLVASQSQALAPAMYPAPDPQTCPLPYCPGFLDPIEYGQVAGGDLIPRDSGKLEAAVTGQTGVYAFDYDMKALPGWQGGLTTDPNNEGVPSIGSSVLAIADIDGDGTYEILFTRNDNLIHAIRADGTYMRWMADGSYGFPRAEAGASLADGSCLNPLPPQVAQRQVNPNSIVSCTAITVGDPDGDGALDVIRVGINGTIEDREFGPMTNASVEFGQPGGGPDRTNRYHERRIQGRLVSNGVPLDVPACVMLVRKTSEKVATPILNAKCTGPDAKGLYTCTPTVATVTSATSAVTADPNNIGKFEVPANPGSEPNGDPEVHYNLKIRVGATCATNPQASSTDVSAITAGGQSRNTTLGLSNGGGSTLTIPVNVGHASLPINLGDIEVSPGPKNPATTPAPLDPVGAK